ncbi:MAG: zinc protease [Maribacter sp.]|jgi:zinc protease
MSITQAPPIQSIKEVTLPEHTVRDYPNGMRLIIVSAGAQPVFKLETIFDAGRYYENKKMVSGAVLRLLREGAKGYSSEKIAETIDFYGATLSAPTNLDFSGITLYGLNQHFEALLPLYRAVMTEPTFPQGELDDYILERKQQLQVDLSKNDVISYRMVTEAVFGKEHPYGYNSTKELYNTIDIEDVKQHFKEHYVAGNCTVVISGKIEPWMIERLEKDFFPAIPLGKTQAKSFPVHSEPNQHQYISKPNSVQTAIRMGQVLFDRNHPDYYGLYFLNIILGEYFSSRLMMNIREDKGYTYHIYSMLDIMKEEGMFLISTEIANEYAQDTLKEIYIEFERLQNELIPDDELEMARNYTLGTMLTALDGPFNSSEIIKGLFLNGIDATHFDQLIETIQNISKEELMLLAKKYLNKEDMYTVLVGK